MGQYHYQIAMMGNPWIELSKLQDLIERATIELGLEPSMVRVIAEDEMSSRDRKSPLVAVFFGYLGAKTDWHPQIKLVHKDSLPIIPVVYDLDGFRAKVPEILESINGFQLRDDADMARLVSIIFENLNLLREERRLFISYRRIESTGVAIQLFEALDSRGFDVFLDTRSVRPAVNFQSELWHRLSDSDVVILLDTPDFRLSDWTVKELTQANATNVQILHLLWPEVIPDASSSFSDFFQLDVGSFADKAMPNLTSRLSEQCLSEVCRRSESLRARALAARYAYLVDNFCDVARSHGHDVAIHPERYVSFETAGKTIAVFPVVGVPTSPRLEAFEEIVRHMNPPPAVRVIYDERGILDRWRLHLGWLSSHLPVKAVQMSTLPDAFTTGSIQ